MRRILPFAALALAGCGLTLDFDPADLDAGPRLDAEPPDAPSRTCLPVDEGQSCTITADAVPHVCIGGSCVPSVCGDGVVDEAIGEECEGESAECASCRLACDCPPVATPCADSACVSGSCVTTLRPDGASCDLAGASGVCRSGSCVSSLCGNGSVDDTEECDDGNLGTNDGCEPDCTLTCENDVDCDDNDMCTGAEACVSIGGSSRRCVVEDGSVPVPDDCEVCDPDVGLFRIDEDGDGYYPGDPSTCSASLRDCDDGDPTVNPGAVEQCDGVDNDCDGMLDEGLTITSCGIDRDGDGWPSTTSMMSTSGCAPCATGFAPVRTNSTTGAPVFDCWDEPSNGANVFPGQRMFFPDPYCLGGTSGCAHPFDYNCDGIEERQDESPGVRCDLLTLRGCRGGGWSTAVPGCGASGTFVGCEPGVLLCRGNAMTRTQACR